MNVLSAVPDSEMQGSFVKIPLSAKTIMVIKKKSK